MCSLFVGVSRAYLKGVAMKNQRRKEEKKKKTEMENELVRKNASMKHRDKWKMHTHSVRFARVPAASAPILAILATAFTGTVTRVWYNGAIVSSFSVEAVLRNDGRLQTITAKRVRRYNIPNSIAYRQHFNIDRSFKRNVQSS